MTLEQVYNMIPFAEQYLAQAYPQPSPLDLSDSAISLKEFVLSALKNSFRDNYAGQNTYNIGIILFFTMIAVILCWKFLSKTGRIIGLLGILACILSTDLVPWGHLQDTLLRVIQFPWRFLTIASLLLSCTFGELMSVLLHSRTCKKRSRAPRIGAAAMTAVILVVFFMSELDYFRFGKEIHTSYTDENDIFAENPGHEDDYTPSAALASIEGIRSHEVFVDGQEVSLDEASILSDVNTQIFDNPVLENAVNVDLPIAAYANLHVYQTDGETSTELTYTVSDRGTLLVDQTGEGVLSVVHVPSIADWLSITISAMGWILILWLYFCASGKGCSESLELSAGSSETNLQELK